MGRDKKLVAHKGEGESEFKDFYTINIELVCATVGIPPNVALMKYDSNFSAARAALKDWEHSLFDVRTDFYKHFMIPIYNMWLDVQVLNGRVKALGYLEALLKNNRHVLDAYRSAVFTGANVPHIDPEKEVRAERLKLGDLGATLPLTTLEKATKVINGGNSNSNMRQFSKELKSAEELDIMPAEEALTTEGEGSGGSGTTYVKGYYKKAGKS
jgi:capsid protein